MKHSKKWPLAIAAAIMLAVTWLDNDHSSFQNLTPEEIAPVIVITAVIFLVKTGVLSAVLMGLKKLWDFLRQN